MSDAATSRSVVSAKADDANRYWEDDPTAGQLRMVDFAKDVQPVSPLFEGIKIVDCDTHFTEPADLFRRDVPVRLRDRLPRIERVNGRDRWIVGDRDFGTIGGNVVSKDRHKLLGRMAFETYDEIDPGAYLVKPRLEMMDAIGIYAQICFQNSGLTQAGSLLGLNDDELALTIMQINNDACAERMEESGGRIFCMGTLPYWTKENLLSETRRMIDMGVRGVVMPDRPERIGTPGFLGEDHNVSPYWEEFFDICSESGTPINFHINTALDPRLAVWDNQTFQSRIPVTAMITNIGCCTTLANFVTSGLLDRFPKLKIGLIESGIGWVPYALEFLEHQCAELLTSVSKGLKRSPREYFEQFWVSYWFESFAPRTMIEEIGPRRIMFETDYPHPTSLYPDVQQHLVNTLGGHDYSTRKLILERNAVELYNLPF